METAKRPNYLVRSVVLVVIGALFALPTYHFWGKAGHLAERGVREEVTIHKVYERVTRDEAAQGVGEVRKHWMSVFRYGPEGEYEDEYAAGVNRQAGDVLTLVYDSERPEFFVVNPKGEEQMGLFWSIPGVSIRTALLGLTALFWLIALLNLLAWVRGEQNDPRFGGRA